MNNNDIYLQQEPSSRTLRLLNGVLNGCEFKIDSSRVLVIVSDISQTNNLSPLDDLPTDTIFLPVNEGGINFELVFDSEDTNENSILIRELNESGAYEKYVSYNNVIQVGELFFAVKRASEEWSDVVLNAKKLSKKEKRQLISTAGKHYILVYFAITTLFLVLIAFCMHIYNSETHYMRRLSELLQNRELIFTEGRDHILYVVAKDENRAIWANQVIERGDFSKSRVKVISPNDEIQRIYLWLGDNYPKLQYFRIQLGRSLVPILLVSWQRTKLTKGQLESMRVRLMELLPYVNNINIVLVDDNDLIQEAEQSLQSLGVQYVKESNDNYISYNITGELTDSELLRLKLFINNFYRQWGTEFIIFNVSLQSDPLKDKSYLTGENHFIKNSQNQWTFTTPIVQQEK